MSIRWFYLAVGVIAMLFAGVLYAWSIFLYRRTAGGSAFQACRLRIALIIAGALSMAGLGIGIAYNVLIATVSAWFPDKKGLCSGCLMMGFGASALILGNVADALFKSTLGWRSTYVILGVGICVVLILAALLLRKPGQETILPQPKAAKATGTEDFERQDYTSRQMLGRPSFWMAFLCISFLAAVGSSVISFVL